MVLGASAYCGSGQDTLADSFCQYLGFLKYSINPYTIWSRSEFDK